TSRSPKSESVGGEKFQVINLEVGKWGNGEMGKWGNGEMGKWGNGGIQLTPQHLTSIFTLF
ncbi:MAG: hypothetical protein ACKO7A_27285, partial [Microcystis sp.]